MISHRAGLLLAVTGATLFALRPVLVKLIYVYPVDPGTVLMWRMLFALPCYLLIGAYTLKFTDQTFHSKSRTIMSAMMVGVLAYYFAALFDLIGLQYVSAQLGRMILYTYPTFVTLFGLWLFKYRVNPLTWIALIVSYAGIGLIFIHDLGFYGSEVVRGALWIVASAVCFSLYLLFSKRLIHQLGSVLFTCIAMGAASLAICLHYIVARVAGDGDLFGAGIPHPTALALILVMSIACTVVPSFMISAAIKRIGASKTSIAGTFGPAMTAVFAVMLIGEAFTLYHFLGMALVISAITMASLKQTEEHRN